MRKMQNIKNFIINVMEEWEVPGLVICIIKENELFFMDGFGYRNLKRSLPVDLNTLFCIGSITKSFTATAIGILVDRKILNWDDPIKKYLSEFKLQNLYASEYLTLRDLLSHKTGVSSNDDILFSNNKIKTREQVLDLLKHFNPNGEFRIKYCYNNFMYVILGYLIEKLIGITWEQFVTDNILIPLEMKNTYFLGIEANKTGNLSIPYYYNEESKGSLLPFPTDYYLHDDIAFMNPAGGIISCINDIYKWISLNLNGGGLNNKEVISQSSLHELYSPQVVISVPKLHKELSYEHYAMGWKVQFYKGNYLIRNGGHVRGYSAECNFMPQNRIGIGILCNRANVPIGQIISMYVYDTLLGQDITNWNERFKKMYADREEKEKKLIEDRYTRRKNDTAPSHLLSDFVGTYSNDCYGSIQIEENQGSLQIKIKKDYFQLNHFHYNVFEFFDNFGRRFEVNFNTDFNGNISVLLMKFEINSDPIVFLRISDDG